MVEDWELKAVERRIDSLEESIERDRERAQTKKERERSRAERRSERIDSILFTLYGLALAAIFLSAAGLLPHR